MNAMNTTTRPAASQAPGAAEDVIVPLRRPGRWIGVAVVTLIVAYLVIGAATNPNMRWDVVGEYLFSPLILEGLWMTIQLTVLAMVIGVALGVVLAIMRLSDNPVLRWVSVTYGLIFRGVPVIVQLLFWYFLSALVPMLGIGIPFGPQFIEVETNAVISQLGAALLAFGLHEAAYMSEIVRSGIVSVDQGQREAAAALGMSKGRIFRRIIFPQAMRVILPPTGNQVIILLKTTSLVLVIALPDLMTTVTHIYTRNFLQIPLLIVASIWYLVMTGALTVGQHYLERHFGRGSERNARPETRASRRAKERSR